MQTFLPYADFKKTFETLDYKRLGKQRVEAKQLLDILCKRNVESKWFYHPITKMWSGYQNALKLYHNLCLTEWINRGYKNNMEYELIDNKIRPESVDDWIRYPHWFGNDLFHSSHRANLLRKDKEFYSTYNWKEDSNDPYAWYDIYKKRWYLQHSGTKNKEWL